MQLEARRWTRYGKDRVYVAAPDGSRVGWLDLLTQEQHLEQSALSGEFMIALEPYLSSLASTPLQGAVAEPPAPSHSPAEERWEDLAQRRAGQLVRAEAEDHLAGMKERSKVGTFLARAFDVKTDRRRRRGRLSENITLKRTGDKLLNENSTLKQRVEQLEDQARKWAEASPAIV